MAAGAANRSAGDGAKTPKAKQEAAASPPGTGRHFRVPLLNRKAKMCKFAMQGSCNMGALCRYAHTEEEVVCSAISRTKVCTTLINTGLCEDPKCAYAHNQEDMRRISKQEAQELLERRPRRRQRARGPKDVPQELQDVALKPYPLTWPEEQQQQQHAQTQPPSRGGTDPPPLKDPFGFQSASLAASEAMMPMPWAAYMNEVLLGASLPTATLPPYGLIGSEDARFALAQSAPPGFPMLGDKPELAHAEGLAMLEHAPVGATTSDPMQEPPRRSQGGCTRLGDVEFDPSIAFADARSRLLVLLEQSLKSSR